MSVKIAEIAGTRALGQHRTAGLLLALAVGISAGGVKTLYAQGFASSSRPDLARPAEATPRPAPLPERATGDYLINVDDVLDVYFYDVPELSREYTVGRTGTISIPLLPKPVESAGLTADQLARSIEENFRQTGRLSRPDVTVTVKESRWSVVTVEGAVRSPQAVPVPGASTLLTVLAQCGGRADDAGNTLTITRGSVALRELTRSGATPSPTVTVPFKRLVDVNDSMSKLEVWPGDRISVDHAGLFYVLGQVGHPGGYNLKSADEQVSVLQALALAGDITSIAKVSRTIILRKNPKTPNGRDEIALNMKDILQGRSPDRVLEADDILYVPASGSKRTIRELGTIGQVVVTGTAGAVIYSRF